MDGLQGCRHFLTMNKGSNEHCTLTSSSEIVYKGSQHLTYLIFEEISIFPYLQSK